MTALRVQLPLLSTLLLKEDNRDESICVHICLSLLRLAKMICFGFGSPLSPFESLPSESPLELAVARR